MKPTKASALRELALPELQSKLREATENYFKLQLRKETRQMDDLVSVRVARRNLARLKTLLTEKGRKAAKGTKA
jgi:large subunit ribosomal protein L29